MTFQIFTGGESEEDDISEDVNDEGYKEIVMREGDDDRRVKCV